VDAVDGAAAPDGRMTSQPSLAAIIAALAGTERETALALDSALALEPYWEAVRTLYAPYEAGLPAPTGRVYRHEIPGGQLSNLRHQAGAIGVGDRFEEVEAAYERANALLGNIIKVTPTSKVVGDRRCSRCRPGSTLTSSNARPRDSNSPGLRARLPPPARSAARRRDSRSRSPNAR